MNDVQAKKHVLKCFNLENNMYEGYIFVKSVDNPNQISDNDNDNKIKNIFLLYTFISYITFFVICGEGGTGAGTCDLRP